MLGCVFHFRFGYDSVERVVEWMEESPLVSMDSTILDLGCGNGISLIELVRPKVVFSLYMIKKYKTIIKIQSNGSSILFTAP